MSTTMTRSIARYIAAVDYEMLPAELVETTKKFIMDTIGVGIAGFAAPGCPEMTDLLAAHGGSPEATVMGRDVKLPTPAAAFLNSLYCHALDFDDTYDDSAMHCYVNALPPALALAEAKGGVNGRDFIAAVAVGVDLCARLGAAIVTPLSWIRTSTCGSFGAAASAAKILQLSEEETLNALGIVYSQTSGNAQTLLDGGLTKRMQPALAARAGVFSALMAARGITGAKEVFEGRYGFFNLYERGEYLPEKVYEGLGERFYGMKLSIKPYPSCRMTHSSIDAALAVKERERFSFDSIERVEVYVSKMCQEMVGAPFLIRDNPQVDAQFSIPYTVGVALKYGAPFIDDFRDEVVCEKERMAAAQKIHVLAAEKIYERDLKPAIIKVVLKNSVQYKGGVVYPKGHPENPMSWNDCISKFVKCLTYSEREFSPEQVKGLIDTITKLETIDDVGARFGRLL